MPEQEPYEVEGIPSGYCFLRTPHPVASHLRSKAYLTAFKDTNQKIISIIPVVFEDDLTRDQRKEALKKAEEKLLIAYAKL